MAYLAVVVLAILLLISGSAKGDSPSCQTIIMQLRPCLPYLMKTEYKPSTTCCNGVYYLSKYSKKKNDRKAFCECVEAAAPMIGPIDFSRFAKLPGMCRVNVKLPPISLDFDCSNA